MAREQREKIQNGQKGIRGLKARVGWKCCIGRKGGRLNSGGIQTESHHVIRGSREAAGRQLQE